MPNIIRSQAVRDRHRSSSRRMIVLGVVIVAIAIGGTWALVQATKSPAVAVVPQQESEAPGWEEIERTKHLPPFLRPDDAVWK